MNEMETKSPSQDQTRTTTGDEAFRNEPENADEPDPSALRPQITDEDDEDIRKEQDNGDAPGPLASPRQTTDEDDEYTALLRDHWYLPRFRLSDVRVTEYVLPSEFKWSVCDLNDETTCDEVCRLLKARAWDPYHVYNYSTEFIRWSLCPPGYFPDWHVCVRQVSSGNLVAFIAAIPTRIRVRDAVIRMADFRYMSMKPGMAVPREIVFNELQRRVNLRKVWQQVYRWESFRPAPIAVSPVWQRSMYLTDLKGFGYIMPRPGMMTKKISKSCTLSEFLGNPSIRKTRPSDVKALTVLLGKYLSRFVIAPLFTEEEVNHWLLPRENVVDSFVVESLGGDREITDFFSYTRLEHSPERLQPVQAAHLFYYASSKTPLQMLMRDAVLSSRYNKCNLFFATEVMNNGEFLHKLGFAPNGARVQYHLNNFPLGLVMCSEVGLVLQFSN